MGRIEKAYWSFSDTYKISVLNPKYEEELLALVITLDNIKDVKEVSN